MQIEKLEAPSSGSEPHLKLYLAKGHHEEAKHLAKTLPYYHYQFANLNSSLPATKLLSRWRSLFVIWLKELPLILL